jgi:SAM-dependent methyltransferase
MQTSQTEPFEAVIESGPFPIRFPRRGALDQDEEWCEVEVDGAWRRIRFHDYDQVYRIPGLYETIFYRTLRCNSPAYVAELLRDTLLEQGLDPAHLRVLDLGAGNGMMGEVLQTLGTREIVGVDLLEEAREATERDRPWVYNDYLAVDLAHLDDARRERLERVGFNALATVAALGFGDIPPQALRTAFNLVCDGGWVAFNIKDSFLRDDDASGFARLIQRMLRENVLQMWATKRYCHRLNVSGEPLYYVAAVAQKLRDIPASFVD